MFMVWRKEWLKISYRLIEFCTKLWLVVVIHCTQRHVCKKWKLYLCKEPGDKGGHQTYYGMLEIQIPDTVLQGLNLEVVCSCTV